MDMVKPYLESIFQEKWVVWALAATLFTIPISSSGKSICLSLAALLILCQPENMAILKSTMQTSWCRAAFLLFTLAVIGSFWSPALVKEKILVVEKYSKILYLPIFVVGFRHKKARMLGLNFFLLAMLVTCFISILKYLGLSNYHGSDPGEVFRNHIMTGYMMAAAAYISAYFCTESAGFKRIGYLALVGIFSYQVLFINTGKTGYLIFFILVGLFLIQKLSFKQAVMALILCSSALAIVYFETPSLKKHTQQLVIEWNAYKNNEKDTSLGYRLQFHQFAKQLFYRHPLIGNGTASFTHIFGEEQPVPSWNRRLLEPHSQYWMTASELGAIGLLALSLFFGSLWVTLLKLPSMRFIGFGIIIPFLIGNLSDSLLFYSGTGYLFILLMALCLGESISKSKTLT